MTVSPIAWIALFGYIPLIGVMFWFMRPHRAAMVAFIAGWLLLPEATFSIRGIPNLDKYVAMSTGVLLWMIVLDSGAFSRYRFHWVDLAMVLWCICPVFSSVENGYGFYDGASGVYTQTMYWGIPYLVGRVYFTDLNHLRELGIVVIVAALAYIPLIMIELRMSPQLHRWVYGFRPTDFQHSIRGGGYRPVGFVRGGLTLALFIAQAMMMAVVLWWTGSLKRLGSVPTWIWILLLAVILVLCKSKGALILGFAGMAGYFVVVSTRFRWLFLVGILAIPAFLYARVAMEYNGEGLVEIATEYVGSARAKSLQVRMDSEELLRERAFEKPWFGWGGYGENRVYDDNGNDMTITDSMWIIVFGVYGLVGMISVFVALVWPMCRTVWWIPGRLWSDPVAGLAIGVSIAVWFFVSDRLMNAQPNMVSLLMLGALVGVPWRKIVPLLDAERRARRNKTVIKDGGEPPSDPVPTTPVSRDRPALN